MGNGSLRKEGVRLFHVELRVLARRRIWLMILLIIGLYGILGALSARHALSDHLLNPWQIGVTVLGGSFFQTPVLKIVEWMILPGAFVLGMGEPYSLLASPWNRLLLVRVPSRRRLWWGRVASWYGWATLYALVVFAVGVVAGKIALLTAPWSIPQTLTLGHAHKENAFVMMAWVGLNLLATLWGYITLLFLFSLLFSRPGVATICTLVAGYGLTALGVNELKAIPYLRPLLGARLNGFPEADLQWGDFVALGMTTGFWVLTGAITGYFLFSRRSL